ncbi:MAG: hypothetical protein AVDCRST_MAG68-3181 [uncultured Gemmatimonadetes bacterium]|uniref:NYN domain-containing protein n=1 Tax=uncultured Gemmatimonadota bacterium TaxID=203437 RepID=A0A6J4LZ00_9BACT|nr:MAG: hypothetical protein AVDCRST_MAG68-3181 [uncultured Gemmatimonadota bacterium]
MPKTVCFLVDGFNVYHSLRQVESLTGHRVRWLDLRKLLGAHLQAIRNAMGERVDVSKICYFSALAHHLTTTDRDVVNRHCAYISALESTGVEVVLSKFKAKDVKCPSCGRQYKRHEEKETDVAIAVKLLDVLARGECDTVVLVTGDTDQIPAIRAAKGLFPRRKIGVGFPFMRHTRELAEVADFAFAIGQKEMERSQFPTEVTLADGTTVHKPSTW